MTTRFNLVAIIAAIAVCCSFAGCKKVVVDGPEPESDYYTVSLGMAGDILDIEESPLSRAGEGTDLYGIQVYSAPNKDLPEGQKVTWTKYAYGLFGSNENIKINLLKGKKYKFVATMIVDGQNKVENYGLGYTFPVYILGTNNSPIEIGSTFVYSGVDYMGYIESGFTALKNGSTFDRPNVERYYGELADYIPGLHNDKAIIKMKRTSFGAKYVAQGILATEGYLEIQMVDSPKMIVDLTTADKTVSDIFTFDNVKKAYENDAYTETVAVTLNWHKSDETVFPLGTHEITFKRNKMTTIKVAIETENSEGELGVEVEDNEMTDDDEETTIKDGEIVDTEVDTNA